jgi:hypothetical protein
LTMLQSMCEPPMPAHPPNAVASNIAPAPINIPVRPLRSIIKCSPWKCQVTRDFGKAIGTILSTLIKTQVRRPLGS